MIAGETDVLMSDGSVYPMRLVTRNSAMLTLNGKRLKGALVDKNIQSTSRRIIRIYVADCDRMRFIECSANQIFAAPRQGPQPTAENLGAGDQIYNYDGQMVYITRIAMTSVREERTEVQTYLPRIPGGSKRFVANGFICISA